MGRMLEFRQDPELLSVDGPCQEIIYEIPDRIIGHGAFHNIKIVSLSTTACSNEIQPFIRHFLECENFQRLIWRVLEMIDLGFPITTVCPPDSLCKVVGTIKAPGKVLGEPSLANLGYFYNFFASVIDEHRDNISFFSVLTKVIADNLCFVSRFNSQAPSNASYPQPLGLGCFLNNRKTFL